MVRVPRARSLRCCPGYRAAKVQDLLLLLFQGSQQSPAGTLAVLATLARRRVYAAVGSSSDLVAGEPRQSAGLKRFETLHEMTMVFLNEVRSVLSRGNEVALVVDVNVEVIQ